MSKHISKGKTFNKKDSKILAKVIGNLFPEIDDPTNLMKQVNKTLKTMMKIEEKHLSKLNLIIVKGINNKKRKKK
ncbi:MAG: hypothetical protein V3U54_08635 [Thermodesulfobacteriota bacterium]